MIYGPIEKFRQRIVHTLIHAKYSIADLEDSTSKIS